MALAYAITVRHQPLSKWVSKNFTQSDQGRRCPFTRLLDTIECDSGQQLPWSDSGFARWSLSAHFEYIGTGTYSLGVAKDTIYAQLRLHWSSAGMLHSCEIQRRYWAGWSGTFVAIASSDNFGTFLLFLLQNILWVLTGIAVLWWFQWVLTSDFDAKINQATLTDTKHSDRQDWANRVDSDQTPQNAASDQDLHCLSLIHQFLDTSKGITRGLFKLKSKYGEK